MTTHRVRFTPAEIEAILVKHVAAREEAEHQWSLCGIKVEASAEFTIDQHRADEFDDPAESPTSPPFFAGATVTVTLR